VCCCLRPEDSLVSVCYLIVLPFGFLIFNSSRSGAVLKNEKS
jgi:hypothetical protein